MKTCICTLMKNGHEYLDEWLTYHFNLGIDMIYIYEDYTSKSHEDICIKYPNVRLESVSTMIESNGQTHSRQVQLWNSFMLKYQNDFDWVAFIDLDEFIMLEDGLNLKSFLSNYSDCTGLFMFWKIFKSDGRIDNPHTPLLETYKTEFEPPIPARIKFPFKSFVNLNMCRHMICNHEVEYGVNVYKEHNCKDVIYDKIWLNHYFTRSWEEWSERFFKRGHICTGNRQIDDFFLINPEMIGQKQELMNFSFEKIKTNFKNMFSNGNRINNII